MDYTVGCMLLRSSLGLESEVHQAVGKGAPQVDSYYDPGTINSFLFLLALAIWEFCLFIARILAIFLVKQDYYNCLQETPLGSCAIA